MIIFYLEFVIFNLIRELRFTRRKYSVLHYKSSHVSQLSVELHFVRRNVSEHVAFALFRSSLRIEQANCIYVEDFTMKISKEMKFK